MEQASITVIKLTEAALDRLRSSVRQLIAKELRVAVQSSDWERVHNVLQVPPLLVHAMVTAQYQSDKLEASKAHVQASAEWGKLSGAILAATSLTATVRQSGSAKEINQQIKREMDRQWAQLCQEVQAAAVAQPAVQAPSPKSTRKKSLGFAGEVE